MRRIAGYLLVVLGVLLVILAPVIKWGAAPRLEVAPLGCTGSSETCQDRISISRSSGTATSLFDPSTLKERTNVPLQSVLRVRADVLASANGHTVYDGFTNVTDADGVIVTSFTERIAFDGHTSIMQDCCGTNEDGVPITDVSGLNPYKFPFHTEQKTYAFYDGTLNRALPMKFVGVEQVSGVEVYKFVQTIEPTQFGTLEVPGNLVGSTDASVLAPRFYGNMRTVWVEPATGIIVNGQEQQRQTLRGDDGTDKLSLLEGTLGFTPANVKDSAKQASDGKALLGLINLWIPLGLLVLGLVLAALGVFLLLAAHKRRDAAHAA